MIRSCLALVVAVALVGCGKPPRPPGRGSADSDENQAVLGKLQGYLDCLRDHSQRVFHIADVYRQRERERQAGATSPPAIEPSPDPAKCIKAVRESLKLPPALPELDAAADRFAVALQRVFTLTTAAHAALDPTAKADVRARGDAAQPELAAAFTEFDAAQTALFDRVSERNHAVHVDQTKRLEDRDGRTLQVRIELLMLRAEELIRFAATPAEHLDQLDVAKFTAALDPVADAVEDVTSFAFAHPKDADNFSRFWAHLEDAKDYVAAGRQLAHRARDKVAYSDAEKIMLDAGNEAAIVGSPAALASAYNTLVEDFGH